MKKDFQRLVFALIVGAFTIVTGCQNKPKLAEMSSEEAGEEASGEAQEAIIQAEGQSEDEETSEGQDSSMGYP